MAYTKGQIITLDGKEYRIIKLNGSVAEVVGMTNASDSQQFAASGQTYAGSALDTYLNSTFYATLSDKLKAAIVDKTFTQDSWYTDASGDPDYSGYYGTTNPGTSAYTISLGNAAFGAEITRHVYALSIQDVLNYVLDTSITDGQLQNYNIWKMFWNDEVQHTGYTNYLWLRSALVSSSSTVFFVRGEEGNVNYNYADFARGARAAFNVDLDVYFSLWADENFKTILFKSNAGADAQNANLINFLSANATPSAVTTFDLTSLGLSAGDHTIKVKATATGYADSNFSNSETYSVVVPMPSKGDLITMNVDGTDKQFRVLNVNGNNAEVLMMSNSTDSQQFDASSQVYAGSALDTYLNSTWYDTLTSTAKSAIVDKTFTQDSWYWGASGDPDYSGYYGTTKPGTTAYTISLGNAAFGNSITRHVYALSVQDVLDYVLDTSITDGQLQNYNIWKMFWNDEVQHTGDNNYLWLRSAYASSSSDAFYVYGSRGHVSRNDVGNSRAVRPAFQIDLSQIDYTIST